MPKITFIEPSGNRIDVDVATGWNLMQAVTTNGVEGMDAECSGSCACATCHCYVESHEELLTPAAENELAMLDNVAAERCPNSRLGCQIRVGDGMDGMVVRLPETQV